MTAPHAARRPHATTHHGITLDDPYAWLKDPGYPQVTDPDILAHLAAENAHFEAWLAPRAGLVDTLFAEMRARVKEDDASVAGARRGLALLVRVRDRGAVSALVPAGPWRAGPTRSSSTNPRLQRAMNISAWAGWRSVPMATRLAYAVDDSGSERFTLRVRDLASGRGRAGHQQRDDGLAGVAGGRARARVGGGQRRVAAVARAAAPVPSSPKPGGGPAAGWWRGRRAERTPPPASPVPLPVPGRTEDDILYAEADASFFVGLDRTQDRAHALIVAADHVTSEVRLVPTADLTVGAGAGCATPGRADVRCGQRPGAAVGAGERYAP